MGKSFNSISSLNAYLQTKINDALNKEVAEQVKEEIQTAISEVVYIQTPLYYQRRGGNAYGGMGNPNGTGSLADVNEMSHFVTTVGKDCTLEVQDDAESSAPWDSRLDENIILGYGNKREWYEQPRNFIKTAEENMKESKSHLDSLRDGLIRQGIEVL